MLKSNNNVQNICWHCFRTSEGTLELQTVGLEKNVWHCLVRVPNPLQVIWGTWLGIAWLPILLNFPPYIILYLTNFWHWTFSTFNIWYLISAVLPASEIWGEEKVTNHPQEHRTIRQGGESEEEALKYKREIYFVKKKKNFAIGETSPAHSWKKWFYLQDPSFRGVFFRVF